MNEPSTPPPVPPENTPPPVPGEGIPAMPQVPAIPEAPPIPPSPPAAQPPYVAPPYAVPVAPASNNKGLKMVLGGCAVLLVIGVIGAGLALRWVYNKAEEVVKNPEMLAKIALEQNPDVEMVDMDKERKTLRVKDKKTGKVVELSFAEMAQGKFSFSDSEGAEAEFGPGGMTMKDADGSMTRVGGGAAVPLPEWVPVLPEIGTVTMSQNRSRGGKDSGMQAFVTPMTPEAVHDFYRKAMDDGGYTVEENDATIGAMRVRSLKGNVSADGGTKTLTITIQGSEQTVIQLIYEMTGTVEP